MNAFLNGLAEFISKFWQSASKQSFPLMLLLVINLFLINWLDKMDKEQKEQSIVHKQEVAELRNECRRDLEHLREVVDTLRHQMQKCIEARARLEAQNLILSRRSQNLKTY